MTSTPAMDKAVSAKPPRIQLDMLTGLRGVLAMLVFTFHTAINYTFPKAFSDIVMRLVIGPGEAALGFFFMLSGFVLVWVARPGEPNRLFWRRRIVKIFPNHLVAWVAGVILMFAFGNFVGWWAALPSLFLIQSWIPIPLVLDGPNGPSWSLSCELFFYALFPFLLAWAKRLDARRLWAWTIGIGAGVMVYTALVGLFVPYGENLFGQPVSATWFYFIIFFPPARLMDFTLGVLIARLVMTGQWRPVKWRWTLLCFAVAWPLSVTLPGGLGFVAPFIPGLILMTGSAATSDIDGKRNFFTRRTPVFLGDISFGFYIVHSHVIIYTHKAFGGGFYPVPWAIVNAIGTLAASLFLGWLLHTRVENPAMKRWANPKKRRPAPPPAAAAPEPPPSPPRPPDVIDLREPAERREPARD